MSSLCQGNCSDAWNRIPSEVLAQLWPFNSYRFRKHLVSDIFRLFRLVSFFQLLAKLLGECIVLGRAFHGYIMRQQNG